MRRHDSHERGAVLLILVAVLGLGATSLFLSDFSKHNAEIRREQATLAALNEARAALLGFAAAHGRLPRPAQGRSEGPPCTDDARCTGLLPAQTLGIAGQDAWGAPLHYSVSAVYTDAPVQRTSAVPTRTVLTRLPDGRITYLAGNPACSLGSPCMVAVLWSGGRDRLPAGDEGANRRASLHFMSRPLARDPQAPGGAFDDMVTWLAPEPLYAQMARARVLP